MSQLSEDEVCKIQFVMAIKDALNAVSGKWKLAIVCTLLKGPRRFNDIERLLDGLTPRMLARELRELEVNGVLTRIAMPPKDASAGANATTTATTVHGYALTASGQGLETVLLSMAEWGVAHRALAGQSGAAQA